MNSYLFFFIVLLVTVFGNDPILNDYHVLTSDDLSFSSKLRSDSETTFVISLSFNNQEIELEIEPNYNIITPDTIVTVYGENDTIIDQFKPTLQAYKGIGEFSPEIRISIFDLQDKRIKGFFHLEGERYSVDPIAEHTQLKKRSANGHLVIYKSSDLSFSEEISFGGKSVEDNNVIQKQFQKRVDAGPPSNNPDCPAPRQRLLNHVVCDHTYNTKITGLGEDVTNYVIGVYNKLSAEYEETVNVEHAIDSVEIRTSSSSESWNTASCGGINAKLDNFGAYRQGKSTAAGLWHLLTDCYRSGTVGLAWIGVLCRTNSYGTGVSSHLNGDGDFLVPAHEVGHNFAANHQPDGIMVASNINSPYFSAASQTEMCTEIKNDGSCLTAAGPCTPSCSGKSCGSDGCGGSCGSCSGSATCSSAGQCESCQPQCSGKNCGADGCGGSCGSCSNGQTCSSTGSCYNPTNGDQDTFLTLHNQARAAKGVAPLTWSTAAESVASNYASQCIWGHNGNRGNYGENIAAGTSSNYGADDACNGWISEISDWNCQANTCNGVCGHYTQVVWAATTQIGCAVVRCNTGSPFGSGSWTNVVCNYAPPGNYNGQHPFGTENCNGGTGSPPPPPPTPPTPPPPTPPPNSPPPPPAGEGCASAQEEVFLNLVNAERAKNSLAPLYVNCRLRTSSFLHSQDMADNGYFSATGQDGSSFATRVAAQGYSPSTSSWRITAGQSSGNALFDSEMQNPAKILNGNFKEIGVGHGIGGQYGNYWVIFYAAQAPTCGNEFKDSNEQCDDGNTNSGDGCSSSCTVEGGWSCEDPTPNLPMSTCQEDSGPPPCNPTTSCQQEGQTCGTLNNGCEVVNCGGCSQGMNCVSGNCECTPLACGDVNRECGTFWNGCNQEDCGSCSASQICENAKCVTPPCTPTKTCASEGVTCGTIHDGCETIPCGTCTASETCNAGSCECVPSATCASSGTECETFFNGCANEDCGTCGNGQECSNNKCVASPPPPCNPTTSCTAQGKNCGTINDGCKDVNCGSCSAAQTCNSDQVCECAPNTCTSASVECGNFDNGCEIVNCGSCSADETCNSERKCVANPPPPPPPCEPTTTCAERGLTCGSLNNGCETIDCGACQVPQNCMAGTCQGCTGCSQYASCVNSECVCNTGFVGDGISCTEEQITPTIVWQAIKGNLNTGWTDLGESYELVDESKGPHVLKWVDSQNIVTPASTANTVFFETEVILASGADSGIAFGINSDASKYITVSFTTKNVYILFWTGSTYNGYYLQQNGNRQVGQSYSVKVSIEGSSVATIEVGSDTFGPYNLQAFQALDGAVGLYSSAINTGGRPSFSKAAIGTSTTLTMDLLTCVSAEEFAQIVADIMGIPVSQVSGVESTADCTTGKRQAGAALGSSFVFTVSTPSTAGASSAALGSKLAADVASNSLLASNLGVGSATTTAIVPTTAGISVSTLAAVSTAAVVAAGLSITMIVIIASASTVAVAAVVGGVVYKVKSSDDEDDWSYAGKATPVDNSENYTPQPKRKIIKSYFPNVFDKKKPHQSLTARAQDRS